MTYMSRKMFKAFVAWSPGHLVTVSVLALAGCSDNSNGPTTRPLSADDRQAAALKDPWGYGGNTDKVDISGGDIKTLDKKAMKRDIDAVFNP